MQMRRILCTTFLLCVLPAAARSETLVSADDPCAHPTDGCMVEMELNMPCVGGPGDDFIQGTPGDDVISGGGGNDRIMGHGGNDTICGGDGDDLLFGEDGDDALYGGPGSNVLSGDTGTDICIDGNVSSNCETTKLPVKNDAQFCSRILGKWTWFDNGTVIFNSDNTVQWYTPMTFQKGHSAKWTCDSEKKTFTIPWTNGFTDVMSLIASDSSLQGKNNRGMTIWAQRHR
jgi:hypothetical protein